MKEKIKRWIIYAIAGILFVTMTLVAIYLFQWKDYYAFLWGCYICIPLIIIGLILNKPYLVLTQVIILAIPDLARVFDILYAVFSGGYSPLGLSSQFIYRSALGRIARLQHFYTVPLSLVALSLMKIKKNYKVLLAGFVEIIIIFLLTFFIVTNGENVNCVHVNCIDISFGAIYYIIWFVFVFTSIAASYFIIINLPFMKEKQKIKHLSEEKYLK